LFGQLLAQPAFNGAGVVEVDMHMPWSSSVCKGRGCGAVLCAAAALSAKSIKKPKSLQKVCDAYVRA
jgi:hypothetical protein